MHLLARSGLVLLSTAALALTGAAPAGADPAHGFPVPLDCDNGVTYAAVVSGNGEFTPAHDTASNTILVPTSFGEFSGTVTDSSGTVIDSFTDPAVSKGASNRARATSVTCTFSFTETFEDPELGLLTFNGSGSVSGFSTPAS
jgi:hypothetical protein